jgi:DnaK suppressor protein
MNNEHYREQLLAKERELKEDIAQLGSVAREGVNTDVEDEIDQVTANEAKAGAFEASDLRYATLVEVQDALRRLEEGSYGFCLDCGKPIGEARLRAIPWARYCLEHQEQQDREQPTIDSQVS